MDATVVWYAVYGALFLLALYTLFRTWVVRLDWTPTDRWRTTALVVACLCSLLLVSELVGLSLPGSTEIGVAGVGVLAAAVFLLLQFDGRRRLAR